MVGTLVGAGHWSAHSLHAAHDWSAHSGARDRLSITGRHIHLCGTCCPLLVGTFRCAGHVVHYWLAHSLCAGHVVHYWSVVQDMVSIIGRVQDRLPVLC